MLIRTYSIALIAFSLFLGSALIAQVVEDDATDILTPPARKYEPTDIPDHAEVATRIMALTNQFREQEKLEKVEIDKPQLRKAAQYFADYMARTSRFGHNADGATPADRTKKFGYAYCIVAENIAYEFGSMGFTTQDLATRFVEGWKASPGHRKNMLDPDVTETAVAVARGADSGYFFAVQLFGRPQSKSVEFTIANESSMAVEYTMGERTLKLEPGHTRTHQVCRLRDLAFLWPDAKGEEQTVQPQDGDHFVVTQEGDNVQLRKK
jgi:uncharacterized protein YkwD